MKTKMILAAVLMVALSVISVLAMGKKPVETKEPAISMETAADSTEDVQAAPTEDAHTQAPVAMDAQEASPSVDQKETSASIDDQEKASYIYVKGELKETETGISLFDGKETYQLKADDQATLKPMVGKLVMVSGELSTLETGTVILVKKVDPVK